MTVIKCIGYSVAIALMAPLLALFRLDPRIDYADDINFGSEDV